LDSPGAAAVAACDEGGEVVPVEPIADMLGKVMSGVAKVGATISDRRR
jgi:hypothetical protein